MSHSHPFLVKLGITSPWSKLWQRHKKSPPVTNPGSGGDLVTRSILEMGCCKPGDAAVGPECRVEMFLAGFSVETQIVSSGGVKPPSRLLDVAPGKIFII